MNELVHEGGALVIYDEVITAFRFMYGGAQDLLGVTPDLTALGKVIGGGLPIGAYGGRKKLWNKLLRLDLHTKAGTMAGNPASMASGIACLEVLQQEGLYEKLDELGAMLEKGILEQAAKHNIDITLNRLKGALTVYFTTNTIEDYDAAQDTDGEMFGKFFKLMLQEGVNLAPSKYEAWFLTTEHTKKILNIQSKLSAEHLLP